MFCRLQNVYGAAVVWEVFCIACCGLPRAKPDYDTDFVGNAEDDCEDRSVTQCRGNTFEWDAQNTYIAYLNFHDNKYRFMMTLLGSPATHPAHSFSAGHKYQVLRAT